MIAVEPLARTPGRGPARPTITGSSPAAPPVPDRIGFAYRSAGDAHARPIILPDSPARYTLLGSSLFPETNTLPLAKGLFRRQPNPPRPAVGFVRRAFHLTDRPMASFRTFAAS